MTYKILNLLTGDYIQAWHKYKVFNDNKNKLIGYTCLNTAAVTQYKR